MRRALKVIAWVVVFAACAGVGALIAAHTNPFPPGVEDPGARTSTPISPTPTPSGPGPVGYSAIAGARTYHDLFVGGRCATAWRISLLVSGGGPTGHVAGTGVARLVGGLRCDFHTAQVQSERLKLMVAGHRRANILDLNLTVVSRDPVGSNDYGGLIGTLTRFPSVKLDGGKGLAAVLVTVPDGDQGTYGARYRLSVTCGTAC